MFDTKKVLLVDGHGLAFRGFYALPEMNAPDGTPTNAIVGFFNMLLKATAEWQPDKIGLFFDPAGPTKRNELYDAYKDGRKPTPAEFKAQMPLIIELAEALGYPIYIQTGVEADDLIASTAEQIAAEGDDVLIFSADKDLLQLLRDGITMARPIKGVSEFKLYTPDVFSDEYGFAPSSMADYLALVGDAVDNIPGVPGIGDKGAKTLLGTYKTLDGIYNSLDELTKSQKKKLEEGRESAYKSYELIIPQQIEPIPLQQLEQKEVDTEKALAILGRLGLKKLEERYALNEVATKATKTKRRGEIVPEPITDFTAFAAERLLVLTGSPNLLMAADGRYAMLDDGAEKFIIDWLQSGDRELLVAGYGSWCAVIPGLSSYPQRVIDVEIAHYFFHPDAKSHELKDIIANLSPQPQNVAAEILLLWEGYAADGLAKEMRRIMKDIDAPLVPVLADLTKNGITVRTDKLRTLDCELQEQAKATEAVISELAGKSINLNSPKQVGELLFEKLRLPAIKKTKTGYSTDAAVLEELSKLPEPFCEVPQRLLDYRECAKMSSGFVQPYMKYASESGDGRIHSTFLHTATGTARLASRDPNAQNIPVFGHWASKFREAITANRSDGRSRIFVAADYSQIELRVLAHLTGEERLLDSFANGRDIHLETASWVFGLDPEDITQEQRRFAKTVNFGLIYGMGAHGLAQRMGIPRQQAASLVERYFAVLPKVKKYIQESAQAAKAKGYTLSVLGRIRPLAEVTTVEGRGNNPLDRVAVNTPIQSTAADIAKIALLDLHKALADKAPQTLLVLQVHDSIICETEVAVADEVEAQLVEIMESVKVIDVPLKVEPKRGFSLAEI